MGFVSFHEDIMDRWIEGLERIAWQTAKGEAQIQEDTNRSPEFRYRLEKLQTTYQECQRILDEIQEFLTCPPKNTVHEVLQLRKRTEMLMRGVDQERARRITAENKLEQEQIQWKRYFDTLEKKLKREQERRIALERRPRKRQTCRKKPR